MIIGKTQFPIADFSQNLQSILLQPAPANFMPIPIGVPVPSAPAIPSYVSISEPLAPTISMPFPLDFSWNKGLNLQLPKIDYSKLFKTSDYSQLFKSSTTSNTPSYGTKFGSVTKPTSSKKPTNNKTHTNNQSTVDKLVNKYNAALKHVGDKQAFVQKLVGIANKYNADPDAMLVMMYSEGGLKPSSSGGMFGLIRKTAENYGIDMDAFRNKSAIEQLDDYERILADQVKMAFGNNKPTKISGAILYAMNFTPAYVKDAMNDPNHVLVSANSSNPDKRRFFYANDGKGSLADGTDHISFDTIDTRLARKEREMKALG